MCKYKFGDFAISCTQKKVPTLQEYSTYIGLEHMDTKCLQISRWGSEVPIIGEKLIMHKGDILLGKRNAYLRRAAIAPHDGIFSAHGMILRPKEDIVDYDFFALFMASDYFFDAAIRISVGSLSPTINWKDLKNLEFNLPDLETQRKLAKMLWAINDTLIRYKEMIKQSDELVKSVFIEMFGKYETNSTIGELTSICRGASPRPISKFVTTDEGENWIKIGDVGENDIYITHTAEKVTKAGADKSRRVKPGDFILSNSMSFGRPYILGINGCVHDGWLIISDYQDAFETLFLYHLLRSPYVQSQFDVSANGSCVRNLNSDLVKKANVITPPLELQKEFVSLVNQIDKSRFSLQEGIIKLESVYKKIMIQYLKKEEN